MQRVHRSRPGRYSPMNVGYRKAIGCALGTPPAMESDALGFPKARYAIGDWASKKRKRPPRTEALSFEGENLQRGTVADWPGEMTNLVRQPHILWPHPNISTINVSPKVDDNRNCFSNNATNTAIYLQTLQLSLNMHLLDLETEINRSMAVEEPSANETIRIS